MRFFSLFTAAILLTGFIHAQVTETEKTEQANSSQNEKKEEQIEGRFVGRVMWVKMKGDWKGEAVPIGIDPHFLVVVDILSIAKKANLFDQKGVVILQVHSPAKLFAGFTGEVIGRKFTFTVEGVLHDKKPNYTYAQAEDYQKPEKEIPIKHDFLVYATPKQIEKAKQIAKNVYDGEIKSIEIVERTYNGKGVLFSFQEETAGTYVFKRSLAIWFKDDRRKKNAVEGEAIDDSFRINGVGTFVERVFPLKNTTVQLPLPDSLAYDQVKALLIEIENESYKVAEEPMEVEETNEEGTRRSIEHYPIIHKKIEVSKICEVEFNKKTETIEVQTSKGVRWGDIFSFKIIPNGFELVSVGSWTSCVD